MICQPIYDDGALKVGDAGTRAEVTVFGEATELAPRDAQDLVGALTEWLASRGHGTEPGS